MGDLSRDESLSKIEEALKGLKHKVAPDTNASQDEKRKQRAKYIMLVKGHSTRIFEAWTTGRGIKAAVDADKTLKCDAAALQKAHKNLSAATKALKSLGYLGGVELHDFSADAYRKWNNLPNSSQLPRSLVGKELAAITKEIADAIETSLKHLDTTATEDGLGLKSKKGGQPRRDAERAAINCAADAYEEISGNPAGRINDEYGAYGSFVCLVGEVLIALGSKASADSVAKDVIAERKPMENTPSI